MGSSFVQVYLDTTPPNLTLYYPTNTTQDSTELISITSNENLSMNHEIIIVDQLKVEHRYTFFLQNDKKTFMGNISFYNYPKGIATLYVRLFDEVGNQSTTYEGAILISDPSLQNLKLLIKENIITLKLTEKESKLILEEGDGND